MAAFAPELGHVLIAAAVGAGGWVLLHFFARQLLDFYELRRSVHEELVFTANIGDAHTVGFTAAQDDLRRLSAKIDALDQSLSFASRSFLHWRGYDLANAAGGLRGLSNNIGRAGYNKAYSRFEVQTGLRLPADDTAERLERLRQAEERRENREE